MTDAVSRDVAHNGSTAIAPAGAMASRQGSTSGDVPALLLGALFDQLHHGVVVQDAAGRLLAANRAARDLLGIDPEAIRASTPALRLRVVDERGEALADDEHPSIVALRTGRPVHERVLGIVQADTDEVRWMRVSAHPHGVAGDAGVAGVDATGRVESVLTIFTDVTEEVERARAARFLADVTARLLASIDLDETLAGLTTMVVPWLADWCAVDLAGDGGNESTVRRVGGRSIDPDALRRARARGPQAWLVAPLVADGRTLGAITLVTSGTRRRLDTPRTLETVRLLAERAAMALSHARRVREIRDEVARRARAEEALRAANHDLDVQRQQLEEQAVELEVSNQQLQEQQVELEVTNQQLQEQQVELEVINEQLQENAAELEAQADELETATEHLSRQAEELDRARRRAEEANAAKSQFLAAMSHELRTPLNAITGYVDLISMGIRGQVTDAQQEDLSRIKRSGDHLLRLINDILQFAKLEAGQLQFRLVDVPLDAALRELEELVAPQMRVRRLSFGFSVSADHPVARADRDKMQQIVLNLLSNAIKATEPGGSVRVEASAYEPERCAIVRVSDTGIGIPDAKQATIFDPFVQVDRQLNRPGEGIGLGLAISRDLARSMGGDLTVESTPGKGSTFTLSLPLA